MEDPQKNPHKNAAAIAKRAKNSHQKPYQKSEHMVDACQKTPNMLDAHSYAKNPRTKSTHYNHHRLGG